MAHASDAVNARRQAPTVDMPGVRAIKSQFFRAGAKMRWCASCGTPWMMAGAVSSGLTFSGVAAAPAASAGGFIYVSSWQAASFAEFGSDLRGRLAQQFSYDLNRVDSDVDVMRMVRADPRSVG